MTDPAFAPPREEPVSRMLAEHDPSGRITHLRLEPIPEGIEAVLAKRGQPFVLVPQTRAKAHELLAGFYVRDGAVRRRPTSPGQLTVEGRTVRLENLWSGSEISVEFDGVSVPTEEAVIELDEAGPITIVIKGPWPFMEARHDLEIV